MREGMPASFALQVRKRLPLDKKVFGTYYDCKSDRARRNIVAEPASNRGRGNQIGGLIRTVSGGAAFQP
jgi:hypothetical protein